MDKGPYTYHCEFNISEIKIATSKYVPLSCFINTRKLFCLNIYLVSGEIKTASNLEFSDIDSV